jgi:hypothetical protein
VAARQLLANPIHGIRQGRRRSHCRLAIVDRMMLDGVFGHDVVVVESHAQTPGAEKKQQNRSRSQRPQESESGETKTVTKTKEKQQRIFQTPCKCMFPIIEKVFHTRVRKNDPF